MAFLNSFLPLEYNQKSYIYTIQKAIFSIWLFNIAFSIGDALTVSFYLSPS